MGSITTLRPSATSSGVGWTPSTGTLHGVTSDDSDATYATWSGEGSALILATPLDSPPLNERRHQVRLRARGEDGDAWWAVRLSSGSLVAGASGQFPSSPSTIIGSWGFGAPSEGSTVLYTYVTGQSAGVRITELYLDVDSREAPTYTVQVLDGSGTSTTTVSDTSTPVIRAGTLDLDGLPGYQYRYWVTLDGVIVWNTGLVSGTPTNVTTTPLENGDYVAHVEVSSTLGAITPYPGQEETLEFTVSVGELNQPDNPTAEPEDGTPFYRVEVCAPNVDDLDGSVGYIEVQRVDCPDHPSASTQTLTILGPLASGECAEWVDFSLPRTGVGSTCDYLPDPCCSYYRARTIGRIDGDLRISNWSDINDSGIPDGLIVMWPDTAASIPEGWSRVTSLDSRYPKGVPDSSTDPGAVGGSATHIHTTAGHSHDTSHAHTVTGNTGTASGSFASQTGGATVFAVPSTHTHTRSALDSETLPSGTTEPTIGTSANDPDRLEVVFIESDNELLGVPDGALGLSLDVALSGWADYADAEDRFLKGAVASGNGGATAASDLASHDHSIAVHTHTGSSHIHESPNTGLVSASTSLFAGPSAALWQSLHSHPVSVGLSSSQPLQSGGSGTSGSTSGSEPPYRNLRVQENISGAPSLPVGLICAWRGSLGSIPNFWQLCDGTNGTPDMFGRYPRGATSSIDSTGGSLDPHSHTSPSHTHSTTGHSHTTSVTSAGAGTANVTTSSPNIVVATGSHTHSSTDSNSATPTVGSTGSGTLASTTSEPAHEEVAFIQLVEEPVPPVDPDTFCLVWDENEHLIRTNGPSGPLWAPVAGKFEWSVDRPFTDDIGVMGTRFVTSAPPGGRNLKMSAAVESEAELAQLRAVLTRPLVLISPSDANEVWASPVSESVRIIKIGRIRHVTADFIGTGPEPPPQVADVAV